MCRASGCSVYTTRRLSGSLSPGHPKLVLTLRKMFHEWSDVKNARNSNFLSSNCCVPTLWTRTMATKATSFPALVMEPPARAKIDCKVVFFNSFERFFFSLSYLLASRNGSFFQLVPCHMFVVWQSRVVDSTVAEHHPDSILESNVLNFDFSQPLLRRMNDFPRQFCHIA